MKIKGVSNISSLRSAPALNHRVPTSTGSNASADAALSLYLLQQQEERLLNEKGELEAKSAANKKRLQKISRQLDDLIKSNSSLSVHSKGKSELGEKEKKWEKMTFNY